MKQSLSDQLIEQFHGMEKYKEYTSQLDTLYEQENSLTQELHNCESALKKESKDVTNLEQRKIQPFLLKVSGQYDKKMTKETREYQEAKKRLDQKQQELEQLQYQIASLQKEQQQYAGCEDTYTELYEQKFSMLTSQDSEVSDQLRGLQSDLNSSNHQKKELTEAINVGNKLLDTLNNVAEELSSADTWGTLDLFGGGLLSDLSKHSHLDNASNIINEAQSLLHKFHSELSDVQINLNVDVQIGEFTKFADFFFDDIFSCLSVQDKIHDAQTEVSNTYSQVERTIKRLQQMQTGTVRSAQQTQQQIDQLILYK